jgi:dienelactone hydrolase
MKFFTALLLLLSVSANAGQVTLNAKDGFKLYGNYYSPKVNSYSPKVNSNSPKGTSAANKPGVLMLHQCNGERSMYDTLGKMLAEQGIHAFSLDFRMYGDSVTDTVSVKKIRASAGDRQASRAAIMKHRALWPADVLLAEQFLREKIGQNAPLGVIGASCGGGQAITLAGSKSVDALMFFSSGMNEETLDKYSKLKSTPTFIIAAEGDSYTFKSAQKLFKNSSHEQNRLVNYKGEGHGFPLFKQDPNLADTMVGWFVQRLIK